MRLRLRQICLVAHDLEPVVAGLKRVLGWRSVMWTTRLRPTVW